MSIIIDRSESDYYVIEEHDGGIALRASKGSAAVITESEAEEILSLDEDTVVGDFYVVLDDYSGQGDVMFFDAVEGEDGLVQGGHIVNVRSDDLAEALGSVAA